jgi:trigger factor
MQVSIETTSELSRKMTIQVPEEKIQEQVSKRLKSMAGKVKLDGFRPGKAPQSLIQKRYGQGIREEVVAELIQSSFYDAVREEKLNPVGGPLITPEDTTDGQGLKYVADFEVMPEFVLFPVEQMEVQRFVSEVTEADLDAMLQRLREQRKTWQESDAAAALTDRVTIHFEGKSEGEDFTNGKVENFPVVLGSNQLIPGFEVQLIGVLPGQSLDFNVPFPADYAVEKLAGKLADFAVEVVKIENSVLPELDAEFVLDFGIEEGGIEAFRAEIKTSMEREMARALASKSKDSVMDELHRRNESLSLPRLLVDQELKSLVSSYREEAQKRKQPFDEIAAHANLETVARRRVALGLLLNRIIETNQIKVDTNRVRSTIEDLAVSYEDPQEVINWYYSNREQLSQVQNMVVEDQVVDLILETAKVQERRIDFKDLMQQSNPAVQADAA